MKKNTKPPTPRKKIEVSLETLKSMMEARLVETDKLLVSIKTNLKTLEALSRNTEDSEDMTYRFYHQSFKVYITQEYTKQIVAKLQGLAPHLPLNDWFMNIVKHGTGRNFQMEDNQNWTEITRPMLEAYFHARYFLAMACKYGRELDTAPNIMPSGWGAPLC